jgi:hypothetical protein
MADSEGRGYSLFDIYDEDREARAEQEETEVEQGTGKDDIPDSESSGDESEIEELPRSREYESHHFDPNSNSSSDDLLSEEEDSSQEDSDEEDNEARSSHEKPESLIPPNILRQEKAKAAFEVQKRISQLRAEIEKNTQVEKTKTSRPWEEEWQKRQAKMQKNDAQAAGQSVASHLSKPHSGSIRHIKPIRARRKGLIFEHLYSTPESGEDYEHERALNEGLDEALESDRLEEVCSRSTNRSTLGFTNTEH